MQLLVSIRAALPCFEKFSLSVSTVMPNTGIVSREPWKVTLLLSMKSIISMIFSLMLISTKLLLLCALIFVQMTLMAGMTFSLMFSFISVLVLLTNAANLLICLPQNVFVTLVPEGILQKRRMLNIKRNIAIATNTKSTFSLFNCY